MMAINFNSSHYKLTQPLGYEQDVTQGQIFKQSKAGLNSKFSFS